MKTLFFKLVRFGLVGWLTAALYFLSLYILIEGRYFDKIVSSCISYLLAISINYVLHYLWTFESKEKHIIALFRYLIMSAVGFLINYFIIKLGTGRHVESFIFYQAVAIVVILFWNFLVAYFWVYKSEKKAA